MLRRLFAAALLVPLMALSGCGGHRFLKGHGVETGGGGTLQSVVVNPTDGAVGMPTSILIRAYWPPGQSPPPAFTFTLYEESATEEDVRFRIATRQRKGGNPNEWYFEPLDALKGGTWHLICLTTPSECIESRFRTSGTPDPFGTDDPLDRSSWTRR